MNKYKILLVEDDTEISEMLKNYLITKNYDIICAFDEQEACSKFDAVPVHIQLIAKAAVIVTMSFIVLFIGMAMKSSKGAIISSFLLIILTQANIGDFTMSNNIVFPVILTVISLVFAFLSIYKAETNDLM